MKQLYKITDLKRIALLIALFGFVINLPGCTANINNADINNAGIDPAQPIYGITVSDGWSGDDTLQQIIKAISAMSVKPTVRVVMSDKIAPEDYVKIFKEIHAVAYILAEPVDSYYMRHYKTVDEYLQRFKDSYEYLYPYVDMWEIANEINGEGWLGGSRQFNADKMYAAYKFIKDKNSKTFLTGYEVAPGDQEMSMLDWLQKYVPEDMKKGLDYMTVSYYEDDHHGFQPDWESVFDSLQAMFPNSLLAIGECGHRGTTEEKIAMVKHYYNMPKYVENYMGGYFWWYWLNDCVPYENNPVWEAINTAMKEINWK
jgi:hypothetical protein